MTRRSVSGGEATGTLAAAMAVRHSWAGPNRTETWRPRRETGIDRDDSPTMTSVGDQLTVNR
ncbi:hypothetical protein C495_10214 [Natronorubrum sulfidifaciens JCM 14089]|uniref:Uncharacterized protein n=1 Tax=Natronorubrum sulfidifaciens JCM 14089 TaxID=1230460 RepID=L9W7F6_9EURY|nr:hypothetical protein C495_10214 [Natronorubrum sulfidifaciens JCM 14089]